MIKSLVSLNTARNQIDLNRAPAFVVLLLLAIVWTVSSHVGSLYEYLLRFLAVGAFIAIIQYAVRLGASRLSSLVAAIVSLFICWQFTSAQLAELAMFGAIMALIAEYFRHPTKYLAVINGVIVGIFAAGLEEKSATVLVLSAALLAVRLLWHFVFERLSKKVLVLLIIKAAAAIGVSIGTFVLASSLIEFPWSASNFPQLPGVVWWALLIIILVSLRGLWATVLLKTARSPLWRPLRVYFFGFSLALVLIVFLLRSYGSDILLPNVMDNLSDAGFTSYNMELLIAPLFTGILFFTAGIDRSLYKGALLARKLNIESKRQKHGKTKET